MYRLIAFVICSTGLVYVSRASLGKLRSHGFYRFFAWEIILALFLLNVCLWFHDPFSWHQIISWLLLIISLIPLAFGIQALVTQGKPGKYRPEEDQLLSIENTTARADEAECVRFFGSAYQAYMQKTRMFVPYLF